MMGFIAAVFKLVAFGLSLGLTVVTGFILLAWFDEELAIESWLELILLRCFLVFWDADEEEDVFKAAFFHSDSVSGGCNWLKLGISLDF
jgi:hypothetical protein